ncbi:uncharacterized protein [Typha angustifolia]|uniref:uncharacterized protein n=1 Tax=Typha angustifolia TaxID=59011 RepID=UPI003C2CA1C7
MATSTATPTPTPTPTPTEEAAPPLPLPLPTPPYPELILSALAALADPNGSIKSAISSHIESSLAGDLPPSHASLLAAHLARMADTGKLAVADGNYKIPETGAIPTKRGRGRPPKAKLAGAGDGDSAGLPRPRGRPPKPRDPLAPVKVARPRGRPPKNGTSAGMGLSVAAVGEKRPRGRPPKVRAQFAEVGFV